MTDNNQTMGLFIWENLATSDIQMAKKFYQKLFSWEVTDIPTEEGDTHCFFSLNGKEICSVSEIKTNKQSFFSSQWISYISVENLNEAIQKAKDAGGSVLAPISSVAETGQTAIIRDPTSATFAIWQPIHKNKATRREIPGMSCFHELITNNLDLAGMFYARIFNWMPKLENFGDLTYIIFDGHGVDVGGMMGVPNDLTNSRWINYWCVNSCDKSISKALALGGKIVNMVEIIKRKGCYAILLDPLGAMFGIMQPEI